MVPFILDYSQIIILFCFAILAVSFFVSIPTTKLKENVIIYTRVFLQLLLALFILLPNFGQDWEVGTLQTRTQYKAGCGKGINASLGIYIGIRSINVTLKSSTTTADNCLKYEIINYNEIFQWSCDQTKSLKQQIIEAKYRSIPKPIIYIEEYFAAREVINGTYEKLYYSVGGYCQMCMWSAFILYLVAVMMFQTIFSYGAYYLAASGVLQLLANLVWAIVIKFPIEIPFEHGNIVTKYGFSFWLNFVSGVICLTLSVVLIIMEYKFEKTLYILFGIDPIKCYDEIVYLTKNEHLRSKKPSESMSLCDMEKIIDEDDSEYTAIYYRRRSLFGSP